MLYKWENNTIFIDKIKNRINKENIDNFTKRNNTNKMTIILKSLIRNNNRKNNEIKMRKYFNKWGKNIRDKKGNLISKDILKYKYKKRELTLIKILIKYGKLRTKDKIKRYYFTKWLYINKILIQTEFANAIQNFCHIHLRNKLVENRWKKLSNLLKNKNRKKNRKIIIKLIKKYLSVRKIIKALKRKNKLKRVFMNRLYIIKNKISPNNNLRKIIIRQNNKKRQILLKKAINKWKNKVADYEIGKLKGKILLKIYDKYKVAKRKNIIKRMLYKWENNTIFIDKIKNRINKENANIYSTTNNKNKISILLKSLIRNINRKMNDSKLRNYFNKWKGKIQKKKKNIDHAFLHLLKYNKSKNGKYFINKLKSNKNQKILKKIIKKNRILSKKDMLNLSCLTSRDMLILIRSPKNIENIYMQVIKNIITIY